MQNWSAIDNRVLLICLFLQELHLSDNKIEVVHSGLLNKTTSLRVLNLSQNRIREDRIHPRAWIHLLWVQISLILSLSAVRCHLVDSYCNSYKQIQDLVLNRVGAVTFCIKLIITFQVFQNCLEPSSKMSLSTENWSIWTFPTISWFTFPLSCRLVCVNSSCIITKLSAFLAMCLATCGLVWTHYSCLTTVCVKMG